MPLICLGARGLLKSNTPIMNLAVQLGVSSYAANIDLIKQLEDANERIAYGDQTRAQALLVVTCWSLSAISGSEVALFSPRWLEKDERSSFTQEIYALCPASPHHPFVLSIVSNWAALLLCLEFPK